MDPDSDPDPQQWLTLTWTLWYKVIFHNCLCLVWQNLEAGELQGGDTVRGWGGWAAAPPSSGQGGGGHGQAGPGLRPTHGRSLRRQENTPEVETGCSLPASSTLHRLFVVLMFLQPLLWCRNDVKRIWNDRTCRVIPDPYPLSVLALKQSQVRKMANILCGENETYGTNRQQDLKNFIYVSVDVIGL